MQTYVNVKYIKEVDNAEHKLCHVCNNYKTEEKKLKQYYAKQQQNKSHYANNSKMITT